MAAPVILVEAAPRSPIDGSVTTVRLAGGGGAVPYHYGGQHWRGGIAEMPKGVASVDFDGEQLGGGGVAQAMELRWAPQSRAALAELASLFWTDAAITVRIGPEGGDLPPVITTGLVLDGAKDRDALRIVLADQATDLKRPFLVDRYAGTGGIEGPIEWKGLIKTRAFGACFNVLGRVIHAAGHVVCFGDPTRPWDAFTAVRNRGVPARPEDLTILAWQGTAEATFTALLAASVTEGGGVLCPSIACIKWWTDPSGDLHADVRGETAGGYVDTAAEIAARIVAARSSLAFTAGTVATAAAARPGPFGWQVTGDGSTAAAELSEMLGGVSLSWPIIDDAIVLRAWGWTAPTRRARSEGVVRRQVYKPVATRRIGYRRNWSPMNRGDLAASVLAGDVVFPDGQTLGQLQPAEAGATAGMSSSEAAEMATLAAATAAAVSAIAAAEAVIAGLQDEATDAAAALAANAADIIALGGDVNILDTLVSSQGSQLATNTTSITNINGTLGSYSTLLSAGRPNQVVNGDFSNGLANWSLYGVATYGIGFSATIGTYISVDASGSDGGVYQDIRVDVGADYYISFEGSQNSGFCYVQGAFLDEARTSTVDVTPVIYFNGYDVRAVGHMVAPAGAAWLRVYGAAAPGNFNLTRMMVQRGGATIWQDQATVRTQQQVVSGLAGTTATLSATVSTQGASIAANSTAITTLNGNYATMASLVATQGASVASNTAAISTNAADVATVNTKLLAGRPNLLSNGDFSNGLAEWTQSGGLAVAIYEGSIGRYMDTNNPSGSVKYWIRDIPYPGPDYYTASFESVIGAYPAGAYVGFQVLNAARTAEIIPGVATSPGTWDARLSLTVPPAGAGAAWLRIYIAVPPSCGIYSARFMIQRGQYASIWRDEASVAVTQSALSSLGGSYASLGATVAVQGATASIQASAITTLNNNVTTLFARIALTVDVGGRVTGIEIDGTPVAGGIKLHADYVSIEKPGGGARLEWSDGCIKVYNAAGNLKVKLGNLAA